MNRKTVYVCFSVCVCHIVFLLRFKVNLFFIYNQLRYCFSFFSLLYPRIYTILLIAIHFITMEKQTLILIRHLLNFLYNINCQDMNTFTDQLLHA
jgi:hypothetical protein